MAPNSTIFLYLLYTLYVPEPGRVPGIEPILSLGLWWIWCRPQDAGHQLAGKATLAVDAATQHAQVSLGLGLEVYGLSIQAAWGLGLHSIYSSSFM